MSNLQYSDEARHGGSLALSGLASRSLRACHFATSKVNQLTATQAMAPTDIVVIARSVQSPLVHNVIVHTAA